jgi:hypothetical protein
MDVKGLKIEIYVNIDDPLDVAKVAAATAKFVKSVDNAELTVFDFEVFEQDDPAAEAKPTAKESWFHEGVFSENPDTANPKPIEDDK